MATMNVGKLSLHELVELETKLKAAIAEARARESKDVKARIAKLVEENGFTVAELFGARRQLKPVGIAKYANPDDAEDTWTGRGRKPNWLVARLKKGAKLSSFEI